MMRRASSAHPKGATGMSFSVRYTPAVLFTLFSLAVTPKCRRADREP
jgi:hypothetical protein